MPRRASVRIAASADAASAYGLAAVVAFVFNNPISSSSFDFLIIGTFTVAVLTIVDPMNKIAGRYLRGRLDRHQLRGWADHVLDMIAPKTPAWEQTVLSQPEGRRRFLEGRSRRAFWQPYLAKQRAKFTSGSLTIVALCLLGLQLASRGQLLSLLFGMLALLAALVILWSLVRELRSKISEYCWTVCAYGMVTEYSGKSEQTIQHLDRIRRLLTDEEWDEARQWLTLFAPY